MTLQLDTHGQLKHLLCIRGLDGALIHRILDNAAHFIDDNGQVRREPLLEGTYVVNLFFEPSTRTRSTFEIAAKRLGADVLNLDIGRSAAVKGESLFDTLRNLEAMQAGLFVVRHSDTGAAHFCAQHVDDSVHVLNAGDGRHAHPTQALLDMFTIRHELLNRDLGHDFSKLTVVIVGDIRHSRVARSQIEALQALGVGELRLCGPQTLLPIAEAYPGVTLCHDMDAALEGVHVAIMLRLQRERMSEGLLPSQDEYFRQYGLTEQRLKRAAPNAIVMHPGPINREVEIASEVADGARSVILQQVTYGVAVRMAVMAMVMGKLS